MYLLIQIWCTLQMYLIYSVHFAQDICLCLGVQSIVHLNAQIQLCSKTLFMWFLRFKGSKLWPNNTVNTKFCIKTFLGVIKTYLPKIPPKRDENYANANAETVGQNQFFLENKVVINFDFRSGAKKSSHLDYPFKSYGPKFVSILVGFGKI